MLSGAASAMADCPRTARRKATRGKQGRDPEHGTARQRHRLQSSRRHRGPGPLSTLTRLVPGTKQEVARTSEYSLRRRNTPTDELSHPLGRHPGAPGGCTAPTDQGEDRRNTLWPNPMTRPKAQGLLSGTTIRDTLIGVLRPLLKTQTPDKTAGPTKAHGLLPIRKKGNDSKKPSERPIRIPLGPAGPPPPRSRVADLSSSG